MQQNQIARKHSLAPEQLAIPVPTGLTTFQKHEEGLPLAPGPTWVSQLGSWTIYSRLRLLY